MVPVGWHDWQIEGNREVANHPDLKKAVAAVAFRGGSCGGCAWRWSCCDGRRCCFWTSPRRDSTPRPLCASAVSSPALQRAGKDKDKDKNKDKEAIKDKEAVKKKKKEAHKESAHKKHSKNKNAQVNGKESTNKRGSSKDNSKGSNTKIANKNLN